MNLFKSLFRYRITDPQLAEAALLVFRRHGWYLTPEVAIFSLFSDKFSKDAKSAIFCKLLTLKSSKPDCFKLKKPKSPNM